MADAAILKSEFRLEKGQTSPDFDEIWYTNVKTHAEFKKRKSGGLSPFSKMAAAANLKISLRL